MTEETKSTAPVQEEPKQPQGWRDVQLTPDMPLNALVGFLNVLNQRLCGLEDIVTIPIEGTPTSLTALYAKQAAEEMAKAEAEKTEIKGE